MGFFSFKDSRDDTSIPSLYAIRPSETDLLHHTMVKVFTSDNNTLVGQYDGYGNIRVIKSSFNKLKNCIIDLYALDAFLANGKSLNDYYVSLSFNHDTDKLRSDHINKFNCSLICLRIIKNHNSKRGDKFSNLDQNKLCQYQGYFYDDIYSEVSGMPEEDYKKYFVDNKEKLSYK